MLRLTGAAALLLTFSWSSPEPLLAPVVERFLTYRDEHPLRQYRARRHLHARNHRFNKEGSLEVSTSFDEHAGFRYVVLSATGSGVVRSRALEPILRAEAQAMRDGTATRSALTAANYDFHSQEPEAGWIRLVPKRRDSLLIDGAIFVDPESGSLLRIEGRLARSPSFWTNRVEVVREYQHIAGVRVPVRMESRAWVKIVGVSTLEVTYAYEEINGVPVPK